MSASPPPAPRSFITFAVIASLSICGLAGSRASAQGAPAEEWLLCRDDVRLMSSTAADAVVLGSGAAGVHVRVLARRGELAHVELVTGWPGLRAWVSRRELGARTQRRVELPAAPVLIKEGELVCVVGAPEMDGTVLIEVDTRIGSDWAVLPHTALVDRQDGSQTWRSPMRVEDLDLVWPSRAAVPLSQRWIPSAQANSVRVAAGGEPLASPAHAQLMVGLLEEREGWSRVAIGGGGREVWVVGFVQGALATSGPASHPAGTTAGGCRPSGLGLGGRAGSRPAGVVARAALFCRQTDLPLRVVAPASALTLRDGTQTVTPAGALARARPANPTTGLQAVLIASDDGVLLQGQLASAALSEPLENGP